MFRNRGGFHGEDFRISRVKYRISRKTGIPLTKSGRNQKIGRLVTRGCLGVFLLFGLQLMMIIGLIYKVFDQNYSFNSLRKLKIEFSSKPKLFSKSSILPC